ncbi:hypothetical protein O9992_18965 [Vibrio lentus]|nr:hypothetical protein [Vibrio lentus]
MGVLKHAPATISMSISQAKIATALPRKAGANQMLILHVTKCVMMTETPEAEADLITY